MGGTIVWHSAQASCQGSSHKLSGVPCQDMVFGTTFESGATVIALADGAGSSMFSHHGASIVVNQASKVMDESFDRIFSRNVTNVALAKWLMSGIQWELLQLSQKGVDASEEDRVRLALPSKEDSPLIECSLKDLSSTLLLVIVKNNRYIALHLGDGVIGVETIPSTGKRQLRTLSPPDNGEFANETRFTTANDAASQLRVYRSRISSTYQEVTGFILMSDGPEASLFYKPTRTMAPACTKLFDACRTMEHGKFEDELNELLLSTISKHTSDDCSIALLAR